MKVLDSVLGENENENADIKRVQPGVPGQPYTRYPGEMPHPVKRRRSLASYIL